MQACLSLCPDAGSLLHVLRPWLARRCWGQPSFGSLGIVDGSGQTQYEAAVPTAVSGGNSWSHLSVGTDHVCALKADDSSAWCASDINALLRPAHAHLAHSLGSVGLPPPFPFVGAGGRVLMGSWAPGRLLLGTLAQRMCPRL